MGFKNFIFERLHGDIQYVNILSHKTLWRGAHTESVLRTASQSVSPDPLVTGQHILS